MNQLQLHIDKIAKLCKKYNVAQLYAFGSVLTEHFNAESDVDLLVNFKNIDLENYADNYFDLKFSLEDLLKREVDLLEEKALRNPYFLKEIQNKRALIYG